MTSDTPAWIEEAIEAAAFAVAKGHIRCKSRTLPACKEDGPCYFDAKAAISAFIARVPLHESAGEFKFINEARRNDATFRQLKTSFSEKPDA